MFKYSRQFWRVTEQGKLLLQSCTTSVFFSLSTDSKSLWFLQRWHKCVEASLRGYLHTRAPFSTRQSFSIPPRHPLSSTFCGCKKSKAQTQSLWAPVICCEWRIEKNITIFYHQLTSHLTWGVYFSDHFTCISCWVWMFHFLMLLSRDPLNRWSPFRANDCTPS